MVSAEKKSTMKVDVATGKIKSTNHKTILWLM